MRDGPTLDMCITIGTPGTSRQNCTLNTDKTPDNRTHKTGQKAQIHGATLHTNTREGHQAKSGGALSKTSNLLLVLIGSETGVSVRNLLAECGVGESSSAFRNAALKSSEGTDKDRASGASTPGASRLRSGGRTVLGVGEVNGWDWTSISLEITWRSRLSSDSLTVVGRCLSNISALILSVTVVAMAEGMVVLSVTDRRGHLLLTSPVLLHQRQIDNLPGNVIRQAWPSMVDVVTNV